MNHNWTIFEGHRLVEPTEDLMILTTYTDILMDLDLMRDSGITLTQFYATISDFRIASLKDPRYEHEADIYSRILRDIHDTMKLFKDDVDYDDLRDEFTESLINLYQTNDNAWDGEIIAIDEDDYNDDKWYDDNVPYPDNDDDEEDPDPIAS